MSDIRFNNLYERIAEGAAHSDEKYSEYFISFNKLVNILAQIQGKSFELRSLIKEDDEPSGKRDAVTYSKGMLGTAFETTRKVLNLMDMEFGLDKTPDPEE